VMVVVVVVFVVVAPPRYVSYAFIHPNAVCAGAAAALSRRPRSDQQGGGGCNRVPVLRQGRVSSVLFAVVCATPSQPCRCSYVSGCNLFIDGGITSRSSVV
jgi:hypothetical protein